MRPISAIKRAVSFAISGHYIGKVDMVDLFVAADSSLCGV